MSMDKFGRTRRNTGASGTKQQVLIPNYLLRTDGTNAMQANMDMNNNEIVNVGAIQGDDVQVKSGYKSDNSIVPKSMLDMTRKTVNEMFVKEVTSITEKPTMTSSSHYNNYTPSKLVDGDMNTEWVIDRVDVKGKAWVLCEFTKGYMIYKVEFYPRNGAQKTTHAANYALLEGSEDGYRYYKILEMNDVIDQVRVYEFDVTPSYKYFKISCTGLKQYGMREIKFYEAKTGGLKGDKGDKGDQGPRGFTGADGNMAIDPNGYLTKSSNGLRLSPTYIYTDEMRTKLITTEKANMDEQVVGGNSPNILKLEAGKISGLVAPVDDGDAVNKKYVDDFKPYRYFLGFHDGSQQAHTVFDPSKLYNDLCVSSAGVLTITHPGVLEILIDVWRQVSNYETNIILYLGSTGVKVKFSAGQDRAQIFRLKKVSPGFLIKCGTASSNNYVVSFKMKNYITTVGSPRDPSDPRDPSNLMFIAVADITSYVPDTGIIKGDILRNDFRHQDGTVTMTRDGDLKVFIDILRKDASKEENYVLRHRYATQLLPGSKDWDPSQYIEYALDLPVNQHYVKHESTLQVKKGHVLELYVKKYTEQAYITMKYELN